MPRHHTFHHSYNAGMRLRGSGNCVRTKHLRILALFRQMRLQVHVVLLQRPDAVVILQRSFDAH